jgi:hypothetical protein
MERRRPWWKSILLSALALAFGVAVAVVLVSVFFWMVWDGFFLTQGEMALVAAGSSAIVALQLLVVCVPIWLLLDKLHLTSWVSAVALGFVAPFAYWILAVSNEPFLAAAPAASIFGLFGALAGLVVWWTRPRPIASSMTTA